MGNMNETNMVDGEDAIGTVEFVVQLVCRPMKSMCDTGREKTITD